MEHKKTSASQRARNLSLAAVAGQSGCATVIIVFTALFVGLWLDVRFEQRGLFTFGVLICSIPISLVVMLTIALNAIKRISPPRVADFSAETEEVELD